MNEQLAGLKVSLIHDWLNGMRGGEHVLEDLLDLWPLASISTLFYEPHRMSQKINCHPIYPSALQRFPLSQRYYRHLMPLYPWAMRGLKVPACDVAISVSHCAAKAAPVPAGIPHICYCLTPVRYLYDQADVYLKNLSAPAARVMRRLAPGLRKWDQETAKRVDCFVAISEFVSDRIKKIYGRDAQVIYPAVDTQFFTPSGEERQDFFLIVSAAVPYKRLDLAIEAFNEWGRPLVMVSQGPHLLALRRMAKSNIRFMEQLSAPHLRDLYRRAQGFVFCAEEDFGLTPLEAQACGCPVIALGKGGTAETIVHGITGILYPDQSKEALMEALLNYHVQDFDSTAIRSHAERFSPQRFKKEFLDLVSRCMKDGIS